MPDQKMLPQQQHHPPDNIQADAPKNAKVFGITKLGFINFDELIKKSAQEIGVEYEIFFSNSLSTQYGYMKVKGGKIAKTIPLIEFSVQSSVLVIQEKNKIGYVVNHFKNTMTKMMEEFVPINVIEKRKCCEFFKLTPRGNKKYDDLCERLIQTLIIEKADSEKPIEAGSRQGWKMISDSFGHWESKGRYLPVLHKVISESIYYRESPRCRTSIYVDNTSRRRKFLDIFKTYPNLKIPFLIRESSYMLTFASNLKVYCNQIIITKPNDIADNSLLIALYGNVSYGRSHIATISKENEIEYAGGILNDAILLVVDDTKADEERKREKGVDVLQCHIINCRNDHRQIPVVLSGYTATKLRPDLYVDFSRLSGNYDISPAVLTELLEHHDSVMISRIEKDFSTFIEIFNRHMGELSCQTPYFIPPRDAAFIIFCSQHSEHMMNILAFSLTKKQSYPWWISLVPITKSVQVTTNCYLLFSATALMRR